MGRFSLLYMGNQAMGRGVKHHIVFAPQYRRKILREKRSEIRDILITMCHLKGVDIMGGKNFAQITCICL